MFLLVTSHSYVHCRIHNQYIIVFGLFVAFYGLLLIVYLSLVDS